MTHDPGRIEWALVALVLWSLLCLAIWHRRRRRIRAANVARRALLGSGAEPILLAYASQTGFAETIAWRTADALRAADVPVRMAALATLDTATLAAARRALFIVSTTGEGDPPDGLDRFLHALAAPPGLGHMRYALLALGDSGYQHYCGFGHRLDRLLRLAGAQAEGDPIEVDNGDAAALRHWQQSLRAFGAPHDLPDWRPPAYDRWRLIERRLLNPGSVGAPVHHILLAPIATLPDWRAGDIAEVYPGAIAGPAASGGTPLPHRDYSIASLPADGRIELVARRMTDAEGRPGLSSAWLCDRALPGDTIGLRVRRNRAFHAPEDARPMLLIGTGTGIAGLRAHLKARGRGSRNWLVFGERSPVYDRLFGAEIDRWRETGRIERCDLVFSREGTERRYVQHLLREEADAVRAWVEAGAAIYVCGSLEGMASGVDAALRDILGAAGLSALVDAGRYRRDVY